MSIKILHTSDWHIDVSPKVGPRRDDQKQFLSELLSVIEKEKPHVFIHAGDIFDRQIISAAGLKIFTEFLLSLSRTSIQHAFFISGNHDPAAQLNALEPLIALADKSTQFYFSTSLSQETIGTVNPKDHCYTVPVQVEGRTTPINLGVALFPYVSHHYLGVSGLAGSALNKELKKTIQKMFQDFADELEHTAQVQMGIAHLSCTSPDDTEKNQAPAMIYLGENLHPNVFDARFSYIALGHFHNLSIMDGGRVCYPGSPIPYRRNEVIIENESLNKGVLIIELDENKTRNTRFVRLESLYRDSIVINTEAENWIEKTTDALENRQHKEHEAYVYLKIHNATKTRSFIENDFITRFHNQARLVSLIIERAQTEEVASKNKPFVGERNFMGFFERMFDDGYEASEHPQEEKEMEKKRFWDLIQKLITEGEES